MKSIKKQYLHENYRWYTFIIRVLCVRISEPYGFGKRRIGKEKPSNVFSFPSYPASGGRKIAQKPRFGGFLSTCAFAGMMIETQLWPIRI